MNQKPKNVNKAYRNRPAFVLVLAAMFATLYALLVYGLSSISFLEFQVRIADSLLPLTILFGWPAMLGLSLGCLVANFFGGLGLIDIIGGSIANLIAGYVGWRIGRMTFKGSWIMAIVFQNLLVSLIVGSYLSYLLGIPDLSYGGIVIPGIAIGWFGVSMGSLISMNLIGYLLLKILSVRISPPTHVP